MLPKKERLSVRDIASLEKGRSIFGTYLSIRFSPAPLKKFSVSVSKKVAKRAVDRNRIRRRVYAALQSVKENIKKSVFVMIMPKKECRTIPMADIKNELTSVLKKTELSA